MVIVFTFIPKPLRVLATNFVGLFWNMYLSYICNDKKQDLNIKPSYKSLSVLTDQSTQIE
jgi:hypothetical protein